MEGAVLPSSKQRPPDHHRTIPERPRKGPVLPITSPRMSTPRLVGQELNRLEGDGLLSSPDHNTADICESAALASVNDALEQTDKLPKVTGHAERASLSRDSECFLPSRDLDRNPPAQLSKLSDDGDESEPSAETQEQNQPLSAGTTAQQEGRPSTHFSPGEHASRPKDWTMEDTWRLPVVGGNAAPQTLFTLVLSWLTGKRASLLSKHSQNMSTVLRTQHGAVKDHKFKDGVK
jgi:hypothetical protein